jgi:MarR family 2-MHQ and catechol resistance regulon transcriptional repressor
MKKAEKPRNDYEWIKEISTKSFIELKKTMDLFENISNQFFYKYDISNAKFNVLVVLLKGNKAGIMLSEIGEQMIVSKANITGLIDRLQRQGYVKRIRDNIDRRKIMAVMTPEGKAFTEKLLEDYREWIVNITNITNDEEKEQLIKILKKLRNGLMDIEIGGIECKL